MFKEVEAVVVGVEVIHLEVMDRPTEEVIITKQHPRVSIKTIE